MAVAIGKAPARRRAQDPLLARVCRAAAVAWRRYSEDATLDGGERDAAWARAKELEAAAVEYHGAAATLVKA